MRGGRCAESVARSSRGTAVPFCRLAAVHGYRQSFTDLAHSSIAQSADSIGKHTYRNAFNRIEIDSGSATYWIVFWFENDFAR